MPSTQLGMNSLKQPPARLCRFIFLSENKCLKTLIKPSGTRYASTDTIAPQAFQAGAPSEQPNTRMKQPERTFQRLSTRSLLRGIILGQMFQTPMLYKPGLSMLKRIADSKSAFLNADKNPVVRIIILPLIYRQFCAGRDVKEVRQTIEGIKNTGYSGVILCYSGEIMARTDSRGIHNQIEKASNDEITSMEINAWKDGQLATLDAVSEGDYVGIKYTGAGPSISKALKEGSPPSLEMLNALHKICDRAQAQNKRIWLDAEQQVYHPTIDKWTTDLMRKYNRNSHALISTTIQAYLKSSRQTTRHYLRLAHKEGWTLGIKLVRGAYIASDVRTNIHDTKPETDACYDSIAHDIISKSWPGFDSSDFPHVHLFLAGHNTTSIRRASSLVQTLAQKDQVKEQVRYGQLQGMADDVGGELLVLRDRALASSSGTGDEEHRRRSLVGAPQAYKCLTWGSVKECLHYLVRRAIENQGAAERMNAGLKEMKKELRRRVLRF